MRSLVIYDPADESTEVIARSIAEGLGERGSAKIASLEEVTPADVEVAQLVVVGGPAELMDSSLAMRRITRGPFLHA